MLEPDGCTIEDIREVDWYTRKSRESDYTVITYWFVSDTGVRLLMEHSEEIVPSEDGPAYPYFCVVCGIPLWFWSDVMHHVKNGA